MLDPFDAWRRLAAVGASMHSTTGQALAMMSDANGVVLARGAIIGKAARSPWTADAAELGRMLPEKMEAISRAGAATAAVMQDGHTLWMTYMRHLGGMALRGRPPTPAEIVDLGAQSAALFLSSAEASARLGATALAPFSRQVKANARRIKARRLVAVRSPQRQSH